jgi:hypothetical protein
MPEQKITPLVPIAKQVAADPEIASSRILAALLATRGNVVHAAKLVRCSHRSLCRYIDRLELRPNLDAIREAAEKNSD